MKNFCFTLGSAAVGLILGLIFFNQTIAICAGVVILCIGVYLSMNSVKNFPLPIESLRPMARLVGKMIGEDSERLEEGVSCITTLWTNVKKYKFEEEITIDLKKELTIGSQMSKEDFEKTILEFANAIPNTKEASKFIDNLIYVFVVYAFDDDKIVPWKHRNLVSICAALNKSNECIDAIKNYIEICNE